MGFPLTCSKRQVRKNSFEGGILWRAGINAELDFVMPPIHMANAHLVKMDAIFRAFNTVIIFTAAEAVPHGFDRGRNGRSCPIRISAICYDTAQMLKVFVLIFNGAFQPVFTVQIHNNTALVEPMMALGKIGFHNEAEKPLVSFHLK